MAGFVAGLLVGFTAAVLLCLHSRRDAREWVKMAREWSAEARSADQRALRRLKEAQALRSEIDEILRRLED